MVSWSTGSYTADAWRFNLDSRRLLLSCFLSAVTGIVGGKVKDL